MRFVCIFMSCVVISCVRFVFMCAYGYVCMCGLRVGVVCDSAW